MDGNNTGMDMIDVEEFRKLLKKISDGLDNPTNAAALSLARCARGTLQDYLIATDIRNKPQQDPRER